MGLTEDQWKLLLRSKSGKVGRPPQELRRIVNGILWICRTGAPWHDMPGRYPPHQNCHRYFQNWVQSGLWNKILHYGGSSMTL
ncbi:MAG: transposase [Candidatus Pollutiaquabacter aromativorans]|uniref:transposase n=1 Tax=Candidatus Pollutiaquabacter sp. TaxID=3416354 RepID=UPI001B55B208|nr:transposase [Prolixibacteraceae bacterium]